MNTSARLLRVGAAAALALALAGLPGSPSAQPPVSDAAIKARMIQQSIAAYPGNCPCPYNSARNGSRCGGRSAYNRAGGYAPLCFASDISKQDADAYRRTHGR